MIASRALRLGLLLAIAALYVSVYAGAGRAHARRAGLDPMAPDARAVERALRDGRLDEALSLASALAAIHPDDGFPLYLLATAHHQLGQWAAEATVWGRYAERSASPELACPHIAEAYDRAGDDAQALVRYRWCAERDPHDADRLADLAAALAARRLFDEARQIYDRAIALDPENPLLAAERGAVP